MLKIVWKSGFDHISCSAENLFYKCGAHGPAGEQEVGGEGQAAAGGKSKLIGKVTTTKGRVQKLN